ncbi:PucR family transcriptional regulator [Mycolicibacterium hippocampi]
MFMTLTVGDVIGLPVVQSGAPEVLSARRWDEPLRWVHGSDLADLSALLQGGELVLTTGAALARSPRKYLQRLASAGAIGVVVELGDRLPVLPGNAAPIAEELGLALVVLHRPIRFVEVTEAVHRRIVAEQYEEVAFDRRVHETFTELSMRRASVAGIVDAAARMLDEPVVLEDLSHRALAVSAGAHASTLQDWERRSRRSPGAGGESWATTAVGPRTEEWGRLVVPRSPADSGRATMVLERAAAALALHRMIERDRSGLQQQAQSGLIDDVRQGRITEEREAAARAHALGLRASTHYLPAVVRVERHKRAGDPVARHRRNVALLDAVAHTVNAAGHTGLFALRGDGEVGAVLALKDSKTSAVPKSLTALGEALRREVTRVDAPQNSVLALAVEVNAVTDAIAGLAEAAHIAEVALSMGDPRPYFRAADTRLRGLVTLLRDDRRVQRFAETELRPLLAEDDRVAPSDIAVLREYLAAAGNKVAAAERLHISRPALYKRLARIGDRLGVDLDDGESRTSLHVALLVLDARSRAEATPG